MGEVTIAAYRTQAWLDTSQMSGGACAELPVRFGVQARVKGERRWRHMAQDGKLVIFDDEAEADAWIAAQPRGPIAGHLGEGFRQKPDPSALPASAGRTA